MTRPSQSLIYATLVVVLALSGLDQTILAAALRAIAADLHGSSGVSWVFSAYLIASTAVIPLYGKLADRFGVRPLLLVATALFTLGSLACGLCDSMAQLIAARALQGAGGGGLMTLTMFAVATMYAPAGRGRRQGLLGAAYGIATMLGPLLGAALVQTLSWRWAFLINVPLAFAAWGVLASASFGRPSPRPLPLDVAGAALLAAALVCVLLAIRHDGAVATTATAWFAAAAAGLILLWVWRERRAVDPIVPLALFGQPAFSATALLSAVAGAALFTAVVYLPLYLQAALSMTPLLSAWHLLPLMVGITPAAALSGRALRADAPARQLAATSALALSGSFAALAWTLTAAPANEWLISLCIVPLGLGIGVLLPLVTMASQRSAPARHLGVATATPIMLRALGGSLAVAAMGALLSVRLGSSLDVVRRTAGAFSAGHAQFADAMASGVATVYAHASVVCLLACIAAFWLPRSLSIAAGAHESNARPGTQGARGPLDLSATSRRAVGSSSAFRGWP